MNGKAFYHFLLTICILCVSHQGLQLSKRTGHLKVKLNGDRVEIKGKALTIFEAKMKI